MMGHEPQAYADKLTLNNDIKLGNFLNIQVDVDAKHGAA
jgi:hypothetical protein